MDRSFTFISEVIMNSGLLERVVIEIGMIVYEHTSMTQFEKLSPHLCRGMLSYVRKNAVKCISLCLAYEYSDGSLDQSWFYQKLVKNQNDKQLFLLKRLGMKREILRKLGFNQPRQIISKTDVRTQWRASVKEAPPVIEIVRPEPIVEQGRYPVLEVQTYHSTRAAQNGLHKIKELSFIARPLGVISSAANKYVEVMMALGLPLMRASVNSVLSLAEGSGGTLAILSEILGVDDCIITHSTQRQ